MTETHRQGSNEHDATASRADPSKREPVRPLAMSTSPPPPSRIGQYTIIREIGRGGMGVVYEAQQEKPHRTVALKVINPGVISADRLRRFEHEAEILGRLQHPGIAQIFEAGTFDAGSGAQPYFAMELIRGEPLTEYAARRNLSTHQRLHLMVKVCHAVQHAHQKGVIHRDLKPGNILVTETDTSTSHSVGATTSAVSFQPKILDFGVARATDADVQTATLQTDIGQLIGTVPYMSPEQAGGDPRELDTRSDVYALGVIAYELLAGRLPHNLQQKMIHEAVRIIREDEPTRLSAINRTLRGDVEIVVGKALEKEKERRYQTAQELASDIECYLRDEPITARAPSTWYNSLKFARRNKALVGGIAATFVALLAGLISTTTYATREAKQRQIAEHESQRALIAQAEEKARAEELEKVAQFQASQLSTIDTALMGIRLRKSLFEEHRADFQARSLDEAAIQANLRELDQELANVNFTNIALRSLNENIFDHALKAIEKDFADQPLIKARLLQTIARAMRALGLLERATVPQQQALDIRRQQLGEGHPDTVRSVNDLGMLLHEQGKLDEAEASFHAALLGMESTLGNEHPETLTCLNNLGSLLWAKGKIEEAETLLLKALDIRQRTLGPDHPDTLASINNLGFLLQQQEKVDQAEPYLRQALEGRRKVLGDEHFDTLTSMINVGSNFGAKGELEQAEIYIRQAYETSRRVFGDEHLFTLNTLNNLGFVLFSQRKLDQAEPIFLQALDVKRRVLGEMHPDTLMSVNNLGSLLLRQGKLQQAEPFLRQALEGRRRTLGDEHPTTITSENNLGFLLQAQGKLDEAEVYYRRALDAKRRMLGNEHLDTLHGMRSLCRTLIGLKKWGEAEPLGTECYEGNLKKFGAEHNETSEAISLLAQLYEARHAADPNDGHDAKAAEWRAKLPKPATSPPAPATR